MALDQCRPIPADRPYYPASGAYFFLSSFTWRDFHTQFSRSTKSQRDHSPTSSWNNVCLCLAENMVIMTLSHPASTASSLSTPSENKPSDSSPYPLHHLHLYTGTCVCPTQKKNWQNDCQQISWVRPRGCSPTATASLTAMVAAGFFVLHLIASNCPFHTSEEILSHSFKNGNSYLQYASMQKIVFLVKFHSCVTCDMFQISSFLEKMYPETNIVPHFLKPFSTVNVTLKSYNTE